MPYSNITISFAKDMTDYQAQQGLDKYGYSVQPGTLMFTNTGNIYLQTATGINGIRKYGYPRIPNTVYASLTVIMKPETWYVDDTEECVLEKGTIVEIENNQFYIYVGTSNSKQHIINSRNWLRLSNDASISSIISDINQAKDDIDNLKAATTGIYKIKGTETNLPDAYTLDPQDSEKYKYNNGDVINVTSTGMNYVLIETDTGSSVIREWDPLGATVNLYWK